MPVLKIDIHVVSKYPGTFSLKTFPTGALSKQPGPTNGRSSDQLERKKSIRCMLAAPLILSGLL